MTYFVVHLLVPDVAFVRLGVGLSDMVSRKVALLASSSFATKETDCDDQFQC